MKKFLLSAAKITAFFYVSGVFHLVALIVYFATTSQIPAEHDTLTVRVFAYGYATYIIGAMVISNIGDRLFETHTR